MLRPSIAFRLHARALLAICGIATGSLIVIPVANHVQAARGQQSVGSGHSVATSAANKHSMKATAASILAAKTAVSLGPLETIVQTLNNCGPASIAAVLAYWHIQRSEAQVAAVLRADNSYWGMSPVGLPAYARSVGMRSLVGYGGTEKLVKLLLANGFPVIASQYVSSIDPIRHYRPIEAYNDRLGIFVSADPYLGAGHTISYSEFNAIWAESDYRFQVLYPPSLQARLNAVLRAADWHAARTYAQALQWEEQQMKTSAFQTPGSWIWYNGYTDVAFDEAQLGRFKKANSALVLAGQQGINPVLIGWVRHAILLLEHHA